MTKEQIQALVNKGAITHVGIASDLEKMSNEEICEKYITKHEVAAEVMADEAPEAPVDPSIDPSEAVVGENTDIDNPIAELMDAAPVEEAPVPAKKASKKSKKADTELVVDPVE